MHEHKCADCGFLTFRMAGDGALVEAGEECRELGNLPVRVHPTGAPTSLYTMFSELPICFVRRYPLGDEFVAEKKNYPGVSRDSKGVAIGIRKEVIQRERTCEKWTKWTQGFTPRDHLEMLLNEESLDRQRKFQAEERLRADQRYERELKRGDERDARANKNAKVGQWISFASVVVAVTALLIGIWNNKSKDAHDPITVNVQLQPDKKSNTDSPAAPTTIP